MMRPLAGFGFPTMGTPASPELLSTNHGKMASAYVSPVASARQLCSTELPCSVTPISRLDPRHIRVLAVNHELLRRDFPAIVRRHSTSAALERWLVREAGWMRTSQLEQRSDRTWLSPASCDSACEHAKASLGSPRSEKSEGLRSSWWPENTSLDASRVRQPGLDVAPVALVPPSYGRAMVLPVNAGDGPLGCIDVKGSGAQAPSPGYHNDGLLSLEKALWERFSGIAVEAALAANLFHVDAHAPATSTSTVGHYAVLAIDDWVMSSPSGEPIASRNSTPALLLRQCYPRPYAGSNNFLGWGRTSPTETALRPFGISFAFPGYDFLSAPGFKRVLFADYQFAQGMALIDQQAMTILSHHLAALPVVRYPLIFRCCRMDRRCGPTHGSKRKPWHNDTDACAAGIVLAASGGLRLPVSRMARPLAQILGFDMNDTSTTQTLVDGAFRLWTAALVGSSAVTRGETQPPYPDDMLRRASRELHQRLAHAWPRRPAGAT